jgi:hypothetical protein
MRLQTHFENGMSQRMHADVLSPGGALIDKQRVPLHVIQRLAQFRARTGHNHPAFIQQGGGIAPWPAFDLPAAMARTWRAFSAALLCGQASQARALNQSCQLWLRVGTSPVLPMCIS